MASILLLVVMVSVISADGRGPHHPRGENVVKHHVHYRPTKRADEPNPGKLTQDDQLLHDKEHIQEDLGEWMDEKDISAMTDDELEFHYFQLHDFDNNSRLDGLEILQAIHHTVHHNGQEDEDAVTAEQQSDFEYFVDMIDRVLAEDDTDNDGYLSYPEYVAGRKKDMETKALNDLVPIPKLDSESHVDVV